MNVSHLRSFVPLSVEQYVNPPDLLLTVPVQFLVATQVTLSMKGCRETQKLPAMPRGLLCAALGN